MRPTLAICAHAAPSTEAAIALARECCAPGGIEITVQPHDLEDAIAQAAAIRSLSGSDLDVRFHFPLGSHEITHHAAENAEEALRAMQQLISLMNDAGEHVLTVHAPLPEDSAGTSRHKETRARLRELIAWSTAHGITVCLENLRWGLTCNAKAFIELVEDSGASVTFDVGHAVSSDTRTAGCDAVAFATALGDRIIGAHVYGHENGRHYPPEDLTVIGPVLDVLCNTGADWWTIELTDVDELRSTRKMLSGFLDRRCASKHPISA